jgi:hypothetical protein
MIEATTEVETIPNLNGCNVFSREDGTCYIMLPPELCRPTECSCEDCKTNPVGWNALAVSPKHGHAWTVHMPKSALAHGIKTRSLRMV